MSLGFVRADVLSRISDAVLAFHAAVLSARGWSRVGFAFGAGAVTNLAFAPFFFWPVMFATVPMLVWLIDGADAPGAGRVALIRTFQAGWWFGFGFFFFGLFWIGEAFLVEADKFAWALPFAVTLMPAGLALFFAAACSGARLVWPMGIGRVLVLAVVLGVAEWCRGHVLTGFPWNSLGYSLTAPGVMMQSAGLVGLYSLSFWAVVIFSAPLTCFCSGGDRISRLRRGGVGVLVAAVPLTAFAVYGYGRLSLPQPPDLSDVRLRIVQPSILQTEKWRPDKQGEIFQQHLDLTLRNPEGRFDNLAGISHVIWAEAAMPFLPLERPEALARIGEILPDGVFLLAGALRRERFEASWTGWRAFNSLMVFDDRGALAGLYDKTHLVPFGEYLPLQNELEAMGFENLTRQRGGFSEGPEPRPLLNVPGLPSLGVLICYEAIFPGVREAAAAAPQVYLNVTNDGWFGNTTGPRQHFHQSRIRAVEEGVPLIRVANNGISAVIDSVGRVRSRLALNVRGVIDSSLPGIIPPPPGAHWGGVLFLVHLVLFAALAGLMRAVMKRECHGK